MFLISLGIFLKYTVTRNATTNDTLFHILHEDLIRVVMYTFDYFSISATIFN
jgi:hypothetical protein